MPLLLCRVLDKDPVISGIQNQGLRDQVPTLVSAYTSATNFSHKCA